MMFNTPASETTQVENCAVEGVEVSNGILLLGFTIPQIRRYVFVLDRNGRAAVAKLCGGMQVFGPGDIPRYGPNDIPRQ